MDDEFGEEEAFLNLDDVLEGTVLVHADLACTLSCLYLTGLLTCHRRGAEGTGIDLEDGAAEAPPPPLRAPAALLALEDGGMIKPCQGGLIGGGPG